jgi:hypothetical protein
MTWQSWRSISKVGGNALHGHECCATERLMDHSVMPIDTTEISLRRMDAALARIAAASDRIQAGRLQAAAQTVVLEVQNERLRDAVADAVGQLDTLITRVAGA